MEQVYLHNASKLLALFAICIATTTTLAQADDVWLSPEVHWRPIGPSKANPEVFQAEFVITNRSEQLLKNDNWKFFFNGFPVPINSASVTGQVSYDRVGGDLFSITPKSQFQSLAKGESVTITFDSNYFLLKNSSGPMGGYFVLQTKNSSEPTVIALDIQCDPIPSSNIVASGNQWLRTSEQRYDDNQRLASLHQEPQPLIPTPTSFEKTDATFELDRETKILAGEQLKSLAQLFSSELFDTTGLSIGVEDQNDKSMKLIKLTFDANASPETYKLNIDKNGVEIIGDEAGVFYGTRSLLLLLPPHSWQHSAMTIQLPGVKISDSPRFPYRGMHLDIARNFHSKTAVLQLLDQMSMYKLNKFHLHFCDDEGWRIDISGLPELIQIGSRRGYTTDEADRLLPAYGSGQFTDSETSFGTGHYSQQDFIDILKYADERQIEVIPEMDVPGHARAAIVSMNARYVRLMQAGDEQAANEFLLTDPNDESVYESIQGYNDNVVCICQPGVYRFIEKVVSELDAMYQQAGLKLKTIHVGGDEVPHGVWEKSPLCSQFIEDNWQYKTVADLGYRFLQKVNAILQDHEIRIGGWEEIGLRIQRIDGEERKTPNEEFVDSKAMLYVWNTVSGPATQDLGFELANAGYSIVLSNANYLYFDHPTVVDADVAGAYWAGIVSLETVYEFSPFKFAQNVKNDLAGRPIDHSADDSELTRLTAQGQSNVRGIQGQLWSETVLGPQMLDDLIYPRLLALSERAWAAAPDWEAIEQTEQRDMQMSYSYAGFVSKLAQSDLPRLESKGISYDLPKPGAKWINDKLYSNCMFDNLMIRYTTDGSEPTAQSPLYEEPILRTDQAIQLASFDSNGNRSGIVVAQ